MFIAIDILFEKRKIRREKKVEEALDEKSYDEIIVFPIAIPFIAGPATLATIILLVGNYASFPEFHIVVILALIPSIINCVARAASINAITLAVVCKNCLGKNLTI